MILASLVLALSHSSVIAMKMSTVGSSEGDNLKKVVTLLTDLQAKIESDGEAEQKSYDKFACWCEETLAEKAEAISTAKEDIDKMQTEIISLKGDLAAHAVNIKQLEKDIAANIESQREATEIREKEALEYREEKNEAEQCIGALEAAITVLTGAGTGSKKGFLETLQEAQLLSVVAGVRGILRRPEAKNLVDEQDLQVVRHFVDRPEDFVGGRTGVISAAQIANNPFGDYAPQSTQIQGILKGMYDAFTADLEKENVEEANKQKGFEELMKTKKAELATLQDTLDKTTMDQAEKTKKLADTKTALDDTKAQLEADEEFFASTKTSCQEKATQWAQRTRLRTEELQGIAKAIEILSSDEAKETFKSAESTFFLQISAVNSQRDASVYQHLKALATKYSSLKIARIAATAQTGGHFDKVLEAIDKMIVMLREEAQLDVKDRDFCEQKQNKNKNDMEDLKYDIQKATETIERLENVAKELEAKIKTLEKDIETTKKNVKELTEMRLKEEKEFRQAVKDDTTAIGLLEEAIRALNKFYGKNKGELLQSKNVQATEPMPETNFKDGNYGGRSGEGGGIIAILGMMKEDFEKEIKTGREEDAEAQANFEEDRQKLFDTLEAQKESLTNTEKELSETKTKIADVTELKEQKGKDLEEEEKMKESLTKGCAWVKSHFKSRRDKRQAEIDGLIEAKNFLAGME